MTDSDTRVETWKKIPGVIWWYEASDQGHIRSVTHDTGGRTYPGMVLNPRADSDGYLVVNVRRRDGSKWNGASVARLVLRAWNPAGYKPELEACHGPGGRKDNRVVNLRWDTKDANREEALALRWKDQPPRQSALCPRCQREVYGAHTQSRLRRVLFRRGVSRRNSDAR